MAQTGYTPIQLYHSTTPGAAPLAADLLPGELAINIADGKVFYEDSVGAVKQLSGGVAYFFTTTPVTLADKQGALTNTSGGAFTVTLPAAPATGVQVVVADAGAAWGTNNLTVARNGSTIGGLAENLVCDITGASVQLVYDGTTWEVYAQVGGNGGNAVTLDGVQTLTNKTFGNPTIVSVNSASTAFRITQTGAGNALLVEDEANPDSTPFVVDATGNMGVGVSTPVAKFDLVGDYKEGVVTANTGTGYTINTATGTVQILTLTGNCTFTFPTATTGESFTLLLRQDGVGGRTVTWPANVRWPSGTAPTITSTASRQDKYVFTADGTNWYGSNAGQNYTV